MSQGEIPTGADKPTMRVARLIGASVDGNRDPMDYYQTPPESTRGLLAVEKFHGPIWEPACGDGAISKVLVLSGHQVYSTDLVFRGYGIGRRDFLMEQKAGEPNIVTNPPFKLAAPFARHAIHLLNERHDDRQSWKLALLLKLAFLEGDGRSDLFMPSPRGSLVRVWVYRKRQSFLRNGVPATKGQGGMIAYAWFVWAAGYWPAPTLGWIP